MKQTVIKKVKDLFGSGFRKKIKQAESLKDLKKRLSHKKDQLDEKIKDCKAGTERKLLGKKVKVLEKQIKKIDSKLGN
jgi:chaperonin cofactor prefoldin